MNENRIQSPDKLRYRDLLLQFGLGAFFVVGFLTICVALPLMALSQ